MKKVLALLLSALMICSLFAGCGNGEKSLTVKEGVLTVATSPDFAPYEFYSLDDSGVPTLVGFDIDLAHYIADYMNLELEIIPMDFDGTIMELGANKVDLGMAGYSPDPERLGSMDFSEIYYTGGQSFVCSKEKLSQFAQLSDANHPDYQIGAQIGSIQQKLAQVNTPDADIVTLAKVPDIIAEVVSGKLDGAFIETVVAEAYANNYPDLVIALDVPYDAEGNVIGVNKGNEALLNAVNEALAMAIEDGSLAEFIEDANVLAASNTYQGLLDENGNVPTEAAE